MQVLVTPHLVYSEVFIILTSDWTAPQGGTGSRTAHAILTYSVFHYKMIISSSKKNVYQHSYIINITSDKRKKESHQIVYQITSWEQLQF